MKPRRLCLLGLLLSTPVLAKKPVAEPDLNATAAHLLGRALHATDAYDELRDLCDTVGHRLSGSQGLDRAIDWAAGEMASDGLTVSREPVQVPVWVRGEELAEVVAPVPRPLEILTLGNSVGTGPEGVTGQVMVVSSFDELEERADEVAGRVVLFDVPFTTYGETVQYRGGGASAAAKHGAVAVMVRSVTPVSLSTPHTGGMWYADDVERKIPAVAVTVEDAAWMHRMSDAGQPVTVRLRLGAMMLDETAPSANVVGEWAGRDRRAGAVVLGCHLDWWEVGQGTQDDGAGCVVVMEAVRLLSELPVRPRRTVRAVLYTNEENGLGGGRAYREAHAGEGIVAAVESDTGSGQPLGFGVDLRDAEGERDQAASQVLATLIEARLKAWLTPIGATEFPTGYSGADVGPLVATGVAGFGLRHDLSDYWPIHHTHADTFDKVDPDLLAKNVAAMTLFAWYLAEHPHPLTDP